MVWWHISKWAHQFSHFLQYTSELEVLACSLNTDLNHANTILFSNYSPFLEPLSKVVATFRGKMLERFKCILIYRYITPAALSPGPKPFYWIFMQNMYIFKSPGWYVFSFGLFGLSLYLWLSCNLLDSWF